MPLLNNIIIQLSKKKENSNFYSKTPYALILVKHSQYCKQLKALHNSFKSSKWSSSVCFVTNHFQGRSDYCV